MAFIVRPSRLFAALLASTVLALTGAGALAADSLSDELFCVGVSDPGLPAPAPEPGDAVCSRVGGATLACAPTHAGVAGEANSGGDGEALTFDRLCYEVRCAEAGSQGQAASGQLLEDRFGAHRLHRRGASGATSLVCTPAVITSPLAAENDGAAGPDAGALPGAQNGPGHASDLPAAACADFNGNGSLSATDALGILRTAVGSATCLICVCDVDSSGTISATDALKALKFVVGQPLTLACQTDGNPISWDGGGDAINWTDPLNWNLDRIPNACDAATITASGTVLHASGSNAVRSIVATTALDLTGGTLTLRDTISVAALFRMRSATLAKAHIVVPAGNAPLVATTSGGTLDAAVVDTGLDITTPGSAIQVANGLTMNGTAQLGNSATLGMIGVGEQNLTGTGSFQFTGTNSSITNPSDSTLHIGSGLMIHGGGGQIGGNSQSSTMTNDGMIFSDSGGTLTIGPAGTWTNFGTLGAKTTSVATVRSAWTNQGTLSVDSTSTLNLGGSFVAEGVGTISRSGGTINLVGTMTVSDAFTFNAATGSWRVVAGSIVGGTINGEDGTKILCTSGGGTLDGVVMNADLDLTTPGASIQAAHGLVLNGTATMANSTALTLIGSGSVSLGGTGEVLFTGSNSILSNVGGSNLGIGSGFLIHGGGGQIGANSVNAGLLNEGEIVSDSGGTLTVGSLGTWTNEGTLGAENGSVLTLRSAWSSDGTLMVDGTSTLNLGGTFTSDGVGPIDRSGGTINLAGTMTVNDTFTLNSTTGSWRLIGGTIVGGTVTATDGAKIIYTGNGGTLDGVIMEADMDMTTAGASVQVANGITLNSVATLGNSASITVIGSGNQHLAGTGEIKFAGTNSSIGNNSGSTLVIGADLTIDGGGGQIGGNSQNAGMTNNGDIFSNSGGTLTVGTLGTWTNAATIGAKTSSTATLRGTWTNTGTLSVDSTSILNLGGTFTGGAVGTISRSGGTINLTGEMGVTGTFTLNAATGSWRMVGGKITGGTVASSGGSKLICTSGNGTLDGVTMNADLDLTTPGATIGISNGITLNGVAQITNSATVQVNGSGEQLIGGSGQLQFTGTNSSIFNANGSTLHIGSGVTIHGAGGTIGGNAGAGLTNDGHITCDAAGTLTVGTLGTWTNPGFLTAAGGNLSTRGTWSNSGTITLGAGTALNATTGFTQDAGGQLSIDIAGTAASAFGKVTVTGAASLAGTLNIALTSGFVPNLADVFQILSAGSVSGTFATVNGLTIGGGKKFSLFYTPTSVLLIVVAG